MDDQLSRRKILDTAQEAIERAEPKSKQPRFTTGETGSTLDIEAIFNSVFAWVEDCDAPPPYVKDSRNRDKWLREFWPKESLLAGVLNSVTLIDANRGWSIIGGRNQVNRFVQVSHNLEGGKGWRHYHRKGSLGFRSADIGSINEIGRDGRNGPMRTLWTVDPARCRFTGKLSEPLRYYPSGNKKSVPFRSEDYFSVTSMPSTDETFYDLGYCAVSRAYELAQTMIAVYRYDHEQLGARAPRGLLLLQNIDELIWQKAMETRNEQLDSMEQLYYGGVAVLAGGATDMDVDAKLIALSNLPKDFDRKVVTDLYIYSLALLFGFDPSEFWPVSGGVIGRGTETELQHEKATLKGVGDYPETWQEKYQGQLPPTIQFEFDKRDDVGELKAAQVKQAQVDVITKMYEAGLNQGVPLIEKWEARSLLAEENLIPQEWTEIEEDASADEDTPFEQEDRIKQMAMNPYIQRSIFEHPYEPVVRYHYDGFRSTQHVIFYDQRHYEHYAPVKRKRITYGKNLRSEIHRQDDEILFDSEGVIIAQSDVDRSLEDGARNIGPDWFQAVTNEPMTDQEIEDNPVIE